MQKKNKSSSWLPGFLTFRSCPNRPTRLMRIIWVIYVISSVAGVGIGIHEAIVYGVGRAAGSFAMPRAIRARSGSATASSGTAAVACWAASSARPPENGVVPVRHS